MAQDFSLRYPLIDPQGNFGSVDGDPPAAQRYTECRMTPLAMEMLEDIERDTVDFMPNYDQSETEPIVLPGKFPNFLCNGGEGIAVGMSTSMPPHNLREVVDATLYLLDHPDATPEDLMKFVPGPDFPTAGVDSGHEGREGSLPHRARARHHAGAIADRADGQRQKRHRRHGTAVSGEQSQPDQAYRRTRQAEKELTASRTSTTIPTTSTECGS